ncbi:hypothetical protein HGM15179_016784 [Zosterops borbonicus]|uniref:Uncharacterized protein n=1 Tax=Zosterops borbonicus TaxID=364589 RepID=A0A8K1LDX5_9PASS|nr:hypothetical protein HGM15179_016784 [Zosterops borbonicus]
MCTIGGKLYWEGRNLKHEEKVFFNNEPIILDLMKNDDSSVCLQFDQTFCFSRNEEGMDPESKDQKGDRLRLLWEEFTTTVESHLLLSSTDQKGDRLRLLWEEFTTTVESHLLLSSTVSEALLVRPAVALGPY